MSEPTDPQIHAQKKGISLTIPHYKLKVLPQSPGASLLNLGKRFSACGCVFLIATSAVYLSILKVHYHSLPFPI